MVPEQPSSEVRQHLYQMLCSARKAVAQRGIACDLTKEHMERLWARAGGRCELTGHEFQFARRGKSFKRPFAPSLDRIHSDGDYTFRNVRLVCVMANYLKSDFTDKDFAALAFAFVENIERSATNTSRAEAFITGGGAAPICRRVWPVDGLSRYDAIKEQYRVAKGRRYRFEIPLKVLQQLARESSPRDARQMAKEINQAPAWMISADSWRRGAEAV
jgi:hypothetical protein